MGGIGITPARSMIQEAIHEQRTNPLFLFYSNRTIADAAFFSEFETISKTYPLLHFIPTITEATPNATWHGETGFIRTDLIKKYLPEVQEPIYYLCGPPMMVAAMRDMLETLNIPKTIALDHCWVCATRFIGGQAMKEEHHMVPRAYGGLNGPTVTLCDTHHTLVHKVAKQFGSHHPLIIHLSDHERTKVESLALIIVNAELKTKGDPNKAASVIVELSGHQKAMVDRLKQVVNVQSREAVIHLAVSRLYSQYFRR
jgi:hypothetical protein